MGIQIQKFFYRGFLLGSLVLLLAVCGGATVTDPDPDPNPGPSDLAKVKFVSLGDVLGGGLLDIEFLPGQGGAAIVVSQGGTVYYLRADFTLVASVDISSLIEVGGEQGLLNVAADPQYATNGAIYVYYTVAGGGANRVARYTVTVNPGAGTFSLTDHQVIIEFDKSNSSSPGTNHNGGGMVFDPLGNLIIGVGDGGGAASSDTTEEIAQQFTNPLGKLHRIVPFATGNTNGGGPGDGYTLPTEPADDLNQPNPDPPNDPAYSMYILGVRNPFTIVGKEKNDQLFGDVGGNVFEEMNCLYNALENYGWPQFEGMEGLFDGREPAAWGYAHGDTSFAFDDPEIDPATYVQGSLSIMVLAFIEGNNQPYGEDFDRRALYADFFDGWVRALRVETNHQKTADDHIGHKEGITTLQQNQWGDNFYYGVSLFEDRIFRMELN